MRVYTCVPNTSKRPTKSPTMTRLALVCVDLNSKREARVKGARSRVFCATRTDALFQHIHTNTQTYKSPNVSQCVWVLRKSNALETRVNTVGKTHYHAQRTESRSYSWNLVRKHWNLVRKHGNVVRKHTWMYMCIICTYTYIYIGMGGRAVQLHRPFHFSRVQPVNSIRHHRHHTPVNSISPPPVTTVVSSMLNILPSNILPTYISIFIYYICLYTYTKEWEEQVFD